LSLKDLDEFQDTSHLSQEQKIKEMKKRKTEKERAKVLEIQESIQVLNGQGIASSHPPDQQDISSRFRMK
jgi:hypothetical protein